MSHEPGSFSRALLCRVRSFGAALPLQHVIETMRPLPTERFGGLPSFVCGLSVVRGAPVPVVDAGGLLGGGDDVQATRFVTLRTGHGCVALAVEGVDGVLDLPRDALHGLPPLLREASAEVVSAIGALDEGLLLVLEASRLVPDSVWGILARGGDIG